MRYLYLCCLYYLFIALHIWRDFDYFIYGLIGDNGRAYSFIILVICFITGSLWSIILSRKEKRWFPVLMHQGVFWGLFLLIGLVDTYW